MKKEEHHKTPKKKAWPTKDAMIQVYEKHLWGGDAFDFYSGQGSHDLKLVEPYIKVMTSWLQSFEFPIVVTDLGCGDFNVGKQLLPFTQHYTAVDIVPDLIKRNQEIFNDEHLNFQCLDIASDSLPKADCALIRQVLQHLSNTEVQHIANKLKHYQYVIVTEHLPEGQFTPNVDIISGQGIRLKKQSGINLLKAPFHLNVKSHDTLLSVNLDNQKGTIVTTCYTMF